MKSSLTETLTLKSTPLTVYSGDFATALMSVPAAEQMGDQELYDYQELFANVTKDVGRYALLGQVEIEAREHKVTAS